MNWYNEVRKKTEGIFDAITTHSFIVELMNGSLPKDVFDFYVQQDSLYLAEYKKILASAAVKCELAEDTQFFLSSATGILAVETALHQMFLNGNNEVVETSPTCELYTSYLSRVVYGGSIEEGLAAVLPCFTIYKEVGDFILAEQSNKEGNPYQPWINTYGGEDFAASVEKAVSITNRYAEAATPAQLERMEKAFVKASQLEWMFWDSAYAKEEWPV